MNVNVHDTGLPQQTLPSFCFAWGSVFHFPDGLSEEQNLFSWKLRGKKKTYRACRERNISLFLSITFYFCHISSSVLSKTLHCSSKWGQFLMFCKEASKAVFDKAPMKTIILSNIIAI